MTEARAEKKILALKARICDIETQVAVQHRGRPVSSGIGKKITIYLPKRSMELLDRITREWSGSRSDIIQEAIARYAADLDAVIQEGANNG